MLSQSRSTTALNGPRKTRRIVVLAGPGPLPNIMVNALHRHFGHITVLTEKKEPTSLFLRRRIRLLGVGETLGQVAFGLFSKFASRVSRKRVTQIIEQHALEPDVSPRLPRIDVGSVNGPQCHDALTALQPDVVMVVGTRILSRKTLSLISVPVINYHAGINPKYRGQNGAYWARACSDEENLGATVHLVDTGVDTGDVLHQVRVTPQHSDTIFTYPYLLAAASRGIVVRAIEEALEGTLRPRRVSLPSEQWFHPTLHGYLWTGVMRGVW